MSKLVLAIIVGVFLGAFAVEVFGQDHLKRLARQLDGIWQRTKASARLFRHEFDAAYSRSTP